MPYLRRTMKSKPLTDAKCRNAKFDEAGGNKLFDGGGLFLDLRPSGSKKWRLKYRFNGKENLLTFGDYPATSLADARSRRDEAKRLLAEGKNPAFERDVEKQTRAIAAQNTFEAVALEWYEAQQATWSASHASRVKKQLDREVFPLIGQRPISSIGAPDLLAVIRRIEGREAFETARKTLQTCGQVFRYAVATSRAERDPSPDLRGALKAVPVKHMARVGESELPELLRSIATYEGEPETRLALRFLALTFVRTIELRQAEWTEIDLERREWRIPAEKMKMRRVHIVPLAEQTIALLSELRALTGHRRWLFPNSRRPLQQMSENTILYALYRMGYRSRMTGHGFRGLASTILNEKGFNSDWIERQLAHSEQDGVRAAYNHAEYLSERHRMMQWWADYLDKQSGAQIIPLAAAG